MASLKPFPLLGLSLWVSPNAFRVGSTTKLYYDLLHKCSEKHFYSFNSNIDNICKYTQKSPKGHGYNTIKRQVQLLHES